MTKNIIYAYGTLRTGSDSNLVDVPGSLYNLGWFPGAKLDDGSGNTFKAERLEVSDDVLAEMDRYEGYDPEYPEDALFRRVPMPEGFEGEIYEYEGEVQDKRLISSGDWLKSRLGSFLKSFS